MRTILAVFAFTLAAGYVVRVETRLAELSHVEAGTMTTTWKSGGQTRKVTTIQKAGETLRAFQDRHFAAVQAAQVTFPPDAP